MTYQWLTQHLIHHACIYKSYNNKSVRQYRRHRAMYLWSKCFHSPCFLAIRRSFVCGEGALVATPTAAAASSSLVFCCCFRRPGSSSSASSGLLVLAMYYAARRMIPRILIYLPHIWRYRPAFCLWRCTLQALVILVSRALSPPESTSI